MDLRPKLTKRERLRLPKELKYKKTPNQLKMMKKYPRRKFAVIDKNTPINDNVKYELLSQALSGKKVDSKYYKKLRLKQKIESESRILSKLKPQ